MRPKTFVRLLIVVIVAALWPFEVRPASGDGPAIGFNPTAVTVKTGQTFYLTVEVQAVPDLYAWQLDVDYNEANLELVSIQTGPHLRSDQSQEYVLPPTLTPGLAEKAAATRLSSHIGVDGTGTVAYVSFRALKDTAATTVTLKNIKLVDRNGIEISKALVNSGRGAVTISATAPAYVQPPIGPYVLIPLISR